MPLSVRIIYLQTAVQSLPQYGVQMNLVIHYLTPQTYYHYTINKNTQGQFLETIRIYKPTNIKILFLVKPKDILIKSVIITLQIIPQAIKF